MALESGRYKRQGFGVNVNLTDAYVALERMLETAEGLNLVNQGKLVVYYCVEKFDLCVEGSGDTEL